MSSSVPEEAVANSKSSTLQASKSTQRCWTCFKTSRQVKFGKPKELWDYKCQFHSTIHRIWIWLGTPLAFWPWSCRTWINCREFWQVYLASSTRETVVIGTWKSCWRYANYRMKIWWLHCKLGCGWTFLLIGSLWRKSLESKSNTCI